MDIQFENSGRKIRVIAPAYIWEWDGGTDQLSLYDSSNRLIFKAPHQPLVITAQETKPNAAFIGDNSAVIEQGAVRIIYSDAIQKRKITVTWKFKPDFILLEPFEYDVPVDWDIQKIVYFANPPEVGESENYKPAFYSRYVVVPGLCMSPSVSPIIDLHAGLSVTTVLGSGAMRGPGLAQQWGLPAHYFCAFNTSDKWNAIDAKKLQSGAVCWGIRDLPQGDYRLEFRGIGCSPVLNLRTDLWKQIKTGEPVQLGFAFILTFGPQYHEAIRAYYKILLREKIIQPKEIPANSRKAQVLLSPQYNTWGVECALGLRSDELNQSILVDIFQKLQKSGMKAGTFVIDDKWESKHGQLTHDPVRFPDFEKKLQEFRELGYFIGLWAAFLRCEDPASLGLDESHLLQTTHHQPLWLSHQGNRYGIFDVSQPKVRHLLAERAREFIRRYNPDLIKFDFGYELPSLDVAAPADLTWAGERLLQKSLEVVVGAMKAEKPDLVIMYYGLSPLLLDFYDLHSPDDLVYCSGDYDLETNRRLFLSSLCGELGMPTYSSSGYDWASAPDIWFDSAPSGTLGSLNCFDGDENSDLPASQWIARFNGLCAILRKSTTFSIRPLDVVWQGGFRAGFAPSWERSEEDKVVMLALRTHRLDGKPAGKVQSEVLEMNMDLVLASLTDLPISASPKLGIVPCESGSCRLKRSLSSQDKNIATVIEHYLGGHETQYLLDFETDFVQLEFVTEKDGNFLEWVELTFS